MARRRVTLARKGPGGTITAVGGPSFGFQTAQVVVEEIQSGSHTYFVREGPFETDVKVVEEGGQMALVSTRDVLSRNNLQNLPGC